MQKTGIILISVISFVILANCGNNPGSVSSPGNRSDTGTAAISFKEYEHNFGKVAEGEKIGYVFTFENKGTTDLVVIAANTSCGCTIPKFSKNPVAPGGSGSIEVIFDTSGRSGIQTKTVSVHSNARVPVVILKIIAEVTSKQ